MKFDDDKLRTWHQSQKLRKYTTQQEKNSWRFFTTIKRRHMRKHLPTDDLTTESKDLRVADY